MEPGLDRRDTSALLSAAIVRSGGSAASGPVLQKPMSGSAGPRSPELPSCGHSAAKPNRHLLRTAVDSTLSVHATHGERAHSRRSERMPSGSISAQEATDEGILYGDSTDSPVPASDTLSIGLSSAKESCQVGPV